MKNHDDQNDDLKPLLLATAAGDRLAFRSLFDRTGPKLFGICMRICRDRAIAEDAVQDAFVEVWRKAASFDADRGAAAAWMTVIARNKAIDQVRRRGRSVVLASGGDDETNGGDLVAAIADPSKPVDGGTEAMALSQCLGQLEALQRELVVLAYCEGLSREELSERFDAPVNTVKTWLRRGLASLKICLEGKEG
jgi:RNA polymerase sigma-70 factor (ECF subfamily)